MISKPMLPAFLVIWEWSTWTFRISLTVAECVNITPTTYIRPLHPGILNIVICTANYEATRLKEYNELVRINRKTKT